MTWRRRSFLQGQRVDWFLHETFYEVSCKAWSIEAYAISSGPSALAYSAGSSAEIALMSLYNDVANDLVKAAAPHQCMMSLFQHVYSRLSLASR